MFVLTTSSNPSEGGTTIPAQQEYNSGDIATISATPNSEYVFQNWTGSITGNSSTTTITMDNDKSVVANFVKKKYELSIDIEGNGQVNKVVIQPGITDKTEHNSGTILELTAVADTGWEFKEWKGDVTSNENIIQITMNSPKSVTAIFITNIAGNIQKGPYLSGTLMNLYELNNDLSQSGKNFSTSINDNKGNYAFNKVALSSNFIKLNGLGYYFNEVLSKNSTSQLSLTALHELGSGGLANVNIITTLEQQRVEFLIANGTSFIDAKKQALNEILTIFEISESLNQTSEFLNLSKQGNGNAILLAISSIVQGYRSDAEVNEIISNISTDIKEDGKIDSEITGSKLLSHADFLRANSISQNLINKYEQMGENLQLTDFEPYLKSFIENSSFARNHSPIKYPQSSNDNRFNILFLSGDNLSKDFLGYDNATIKADFDVDGGLKIKISTSTGTWTHQAGTNKNINVLAVNKSSYPHNPYFREQIFETEKNTKDLSTDLIMGFYKPGEYFVDFYELGSETPTKSTSFRIDYDLDSDYTYVPDDKLERRLEYYTQDHMDYVFDNYVKTESFSEFTSFQVKDGTTFMSKVNWQIKDFTGIQVMKNLNSLILNDNDTVESINLSSFSSLAYFDASECDNLTCIIVNQDQLDNIPSGWKKPANAQYKLSCN